ncbi:PEP-CTERM sorting domain-containing protein [Sphingobium sp. H33]|uniref:PEP-CTERM sorting domain-containing protein n=2 Tax=Sphingobium nicotianae TaxID=2782607 RepID=A0A9X1DAA7_9SPHN|nr:PEP-CTERM sorting domain-containing protein [Sphingobium nicotianae]
MLAAALFASPASAGLNLFQSFVGNYGLSTDGAGTLTGPDYQVNAFVPLGATVTAAYLYQATYNFTTPTKQAVSLNGNALAFGPNVANGTGCCGISSARADVTSIVAGVVNGGAGGTYSFDVSEGNTLETDGVALVVVYSLASLPTSTVAILDGWASVTGDTASINFSEPLDPTAPGFTADVRLGIGFSCCGQQSEVNVNGTTITSVAGNYDDAIGPCCNGALITVGGDDDPFSSFNPTYDTDHERYNLTDYINPGDLAITIRTSNASQDDNIFLLAGIFSGEATVVTPGVPEPATWAMMIGGFALAGAAMRRRKTAISFA